jgi:O-antigen/teichoic acid export membrane protein
LTFLKSIVSAYQQFNVFSILLIIEKISLTIFGFIALYFFHKITFFVTGLAISNLIVCTGFLIFILKRYKIGFIKPSLHQSWLLIKETFPILLVNVFIMAYFRIDVILLELITNNKNIIGVYGSIHRIVEMYMLIPSVLMSAVYPIVSKNYLTDKEFVFNLVNKVINVLIIISLPLALIIAFNSYEINKLIFGVKFIEGSRGLIFIIWTVLPLGMNFILGHLLISIEKQKICAISLAFASIINVSLNFILIPKLSFIGTSIVSLSTEIIIFIFYSYFTYKFFGKINIKENLLKVAAIISINFVCFYLYTNLFEYNFLYSIGWMIPLNIFLLVYFKLLHKSDILEIIKLKR